VHDPPEALNDVAKNLEELVTVSIVDEDVLTCVPPRGYVVDRSRVLDPQWSRHDHNLHHSMCQDKI
jgi:hypothetical protein